MKDDHMLTSSDISVQSLVGKRCLLKLAGWNLTVPMDEYRILEISPSGNFVLLMNPNGRKFWKPASDLSLVEVLRDLKAERAIEIGEAPPPGPPEIKRCQCGKMMVQLKKQLYHPGSSPWIWWCAGCEAKEEPGALGRRSFLSKEEAEKLGDLLKEARKKEIERARKIWKEVNACT